MRSGNFYFFQKKYCHYSCLFFSWSTWKVRLTCHCLRACKPLHFEIRTTLSVTDFFTIILVWRCWYLPLKHHPFWNHYRRNITRLIVNIGGIIMWPCVTFQFFSLFRSFSFIVEHTKVVVNPCVKISHITLQCTMQCLQNMNCEMLTSFLYHACCICNNSTKKRT